MAGQVCALMAMGKCSDGTAVSVGMLTLCNVVCLFLLFMVVMFMAVCFGHLCWEEFDTGFVN